MPEALTLTLVSATVVSVAVCVYKSIDRLVSAPGQMVKQSGASAEGVIKTFAAELRRLFGSEPRISMNRRVIQTGGEAIRELALYKETVLISEEWNSTSWKSTKRLAVQQPFTLKAGFDLNRLKFDLDPAKKLVTVTISDSTVVNVEYAGDYEIVKEEHGLWNRISVAERDAILNSLPQKAEDEAEKLRLRDKAAEQLKSVLERMLPADFKLVLHCADDTLLFRSDQRLPNISPATLSLLGMTEVPLNVRGGVAVS
jgi:hypothetical protein